MKNIVPTFYAEYGRYISRFRMIPLNIDGLLPVERRLLLVLYKIARTNITKSAKILGHLVGNYHPHGPDAAYGSLVKLVRNGLADDSRSTWGGPGLKEDASAPSNRYTETRLNSWVEKFAFEFINYVPWENLELDSEPLFLPSILPLGLIGEGIINGIAFHKVVIPKYNKQDLVKRLIWLVKNGRPSIPNDWNNLMNEDEYGPLISPSKSDCMINEVEKNAFYKILMLGEGTINYLPKVEIENGHIRILGRAPNATFSSLLKAYSDNKLPLVDCPKDQCKKNNISIYLELKKGTSASELKEKLEKEYLSKNINFKCYFCDLDGTVQQYGIDEILLKCFHEWVKSSKLKLSQDINKINQEIINNYIRLNIKRIIQENSQQSITCLDDIIKKFNLPQKVQISNPALNWNLSDVLIDESNIAEVYNNSSIKKLIEFNSIENELKNKFNLIKNQIVNHSDFVDKRLNEIT